MATAKRSRKPATKRSRGRPSKYDPAHVRVAYHAALLGATDEDLAGMLDVSVETIHAWTAQYPDFSEARKRGKAAADANVASRLYLRAMGYEHNAVKIVADARSGTEHVVPYVERYPPDVTACIFWLKNRRPDLWRDRQEHAHSGKVSLEELVTQSRGL